MTDRPAQSPTDPAAHSPAPHACGDCAHVDRRGFLSAASVLSLGALMAACGDGVLSGPEAFLDIVRDPIRIDPRLYPALQTVGGRVTITPAGRAPMVIENAGAQRYRAFSLICPHKGTVVDVADDGFVCPNHGARFARDGVWTGGQNTVNLSPIAVSVEADGALLVGGIVLPPSPPVLAGATTYFMVDTSNKHGDFTNAGGDRANFAGCEKLKDDGGDSQQAANIGIIVTAVAAIATSHGLSHAQIVAGLTTFPGLKHRQELVGTVENVAFVNDSKATNADAAEKALLCYDNIYWIAGGVAKEGGIAPLAPLFPRIRKAFLIGEAVKDFAGTLEGKVAFARYENMRSAIQDAGRAALKDKLPGATVLLSPACASFDMFKNFEQRGDVFRDAVRALWPQTVTQ